MRAIVRTRVPESQIKAWKGRHAVKEHYDLLVTGDADIISPVGTPLISVRRNALCSDAVAEAKPTLHWMRRFNSDARAEYAGAMQSRRRKADGTLSKSTGGFDEDGNRVVVASCIAGNFEPQGGRHPFCRQTALLRRHPEEWDSLQPLLQSLGQLYAETIPDRYAAQMETVAQTDPAWVIPGTPFTTITVNNSVPAAYHQDGGDLKKGFGCLAVFCKGEFNNYELVIPEYKVAAHLRDGDVLFFDPTVWHGNVPPTEAVGEKNEDWYRISLVAYYREGIIGCQSPEEELAKAKARGAL
tara:strand:+ start:290 stop:1183 length:894 start_codon:yes stop_codon:yes gene_type:complete